jgi:hypothetical protein
MPRTHIPPALRIASVGLIVIALAGCGSGTSKVEVTGNVTYLGKPVEEGRIRFEPVDRVLQPGGGVIKNGVYHATLSLGMAKVGISGVKKAGEKKSDSRPHGPVRPIYEDSVPKKYNEEPEITVEIKANSSKLDFDLK